MCGAAPASAITRFLTSSVSDDAATLKHSSTAVATLFDVLTARDRARMRAHSYVFEIDLSRSLGDGRNCDSHLRARTRFHSRAGTLLGRANRSRFHLDELECVPGVCYYRLYSIPAGGTANHDRGIARRHRRLVGVSDQGLRPTSALRH